LDQISLKAMDHHVWGLAVVVAGAVAVLLLGALAGLFLARRMFVRNAPAAQASADAG
jgi:hypothetical protein